jgi:multisubunit Na+/H+ antiporter MnhE subunit
MSFENVVSAIVGFVTGFIIASPLINRALESKGTPYFIPSIVLSFIAFLITVIAANVFVLSILERV